MLKKGEQTLFEIFKGYSRVNKIYKGEQLIFESGIWTNVESDTNYLLLTDCIERKLKEFTITGNSTQTVDFAVQQVIGTELTITDVDSTKDSNLTRLDIVGNSVQEGVPTPESPIAIKNVGDAIICNQLIDKSTYLPAKSELGITFTNNGDGSITVNGTATGSADFTLMSDFTFLAGHKYLFAGVEDTAADIQFYLSGDEGYTNNAVCNGIFTIPDEWVVAEVYLRVINGSVMENVVYKPQIFDLTTIFSAGNEPATVAEFREIFPDDYYEHGVGSVKYAVPIKVSGKNLFDISSAENGSILLDNGANYDVYNRCRSTYIFLSTGTYTSSSTGQIKIGRIHTYSLPDAQSRIGYINPTLNVDNTNTFTIDASCYVRFAILPFGKTQVNDLSLDTLPNYNFQLERGPTATAYEPYHEPATKTLYLNEPIHAGDTLEVVDGKHQQIRGILDLGSLTYSKYTGDSSRFFARASTMPTTTNQVANLLCTEFIKDTYDHVLEHNIDNSMAASLNGGLCIYSSTYDNLSAEDFKTAMSGVMVEYDLPYPTVETFTPVDIPTFEDTTIVTVDTEIPSNNIIAEYYTTGVGNINLPAPRYPIPIENVGTLDEYGNYSIDLEVDGRQIGDNLTETLTEVGTSSIPSMITVGETAYPVINNTRMLLTEVKGKSLAVGEEIKSTTFEGIKVVGKNLLESTNVYMGAISGNRPYIFSFNKIISPHIVSEPFTGATFVFNCEPNKIYTISGTTAGHSDLANRWWVGFYKNIEDITDVSKIISHATIYSTVTSPAEANYMIFMRGCEAGTVETWENIQVELGSATTAYVPYYEPIDLVLFDTPQELKSAGAAQDRFFIEKNADNEFYSLKKETKVGSVDLGTLAWVMSGTVTSRFSTIDIASIVKNPTIKSTVANILCDKYESIAMNDMAIANTLNLDKVCALNSDGSLFAFDSSYTDAATFKTAMSSVSLYYELAVPTIEVVDSDLTLAEVSAIAKQGGTISIISNTNEEYIKFDLSAVFNYNDNYYTLNIPFGTNLLAANDTLEIIEGKLIQRKAVKVFDGTEDIVMYDSSIGRYGYELFSTAQSFINGLCSHYQVRHGFPYVNNSCYIGIYNTICYFTDSRFTTAEQAKEFLAEQYAAGTPVRIEYELENPVEINITPNTIMAAEGNTSITVNTDTALSGISANYYKKGV